MKNINACLSHNTDNWRTPLNIYNYFIKKLGCVDTFVYLSTFDEFNYDHGKCISLFCNPPFSKLKYIPKWIEHNVIDLLNKVYLLIPARTDTIYWHKLMEMRPIIYFIRGRLHYNDSASAPFPTVLLLFDNELDCEGQYFTIEQQDICYE